MDFGVSSGLGEFIGARVTAIGRSCRVETFGKDDFDFVAADHCAAKPCLDEFLIGQFRCSLAGARMVPKGADHELFDLDRWDPFDRTRFVFPPLHHGARDIVTIADALLESVARAHLVAAVVKNLAEEKRLGSRSPRVPPVEVLGQFPLHRLEQVNGNDRRMIAGVAFAPVVEFTEVVTVFQDIGERSIR